MVFLVAEICHQRKVKKLSSFIISCPVRPTESHIIAYGIDHWIIVWFLVHLKTAPMNQSSHFRFYNKLINSSKYTRCFNNPYIAITRVINVDISQSILSKSFWLIQSRVIRVAILEPRGTTKTKIRKKSFLTRVIYE